jgi:CSLREA domain-containing protein
MIPALLLAPTTAALAADTYTVTVLTDDYSGNPANLNGTASNCPANGNGGNCSLRDAIMAANGDAGSTVLFTGLAGDLPLGYSLPPIAVNMTIDGTGAAITIDGQNATAAIAVNSGTVIVQNLTIANGNSATEGGLGGAIYNNGHLTVNGVVFQSDTTEGGGTGGAIYNSGTLVVNTSSFNNDSAGSGGALYNDVGGSLTVNDCTFNGDTANTFGGAVFQNNGNLLTVTTSTFVGNTALGGYGGGVYSAATGASVTVQDSTFSGNVAATAGGGVAYKGTVLTLENNLFVESTECFAESGSTCPAAGGADANGNLVGSSAGTTAASLGLLPLGSYGGPTQTMLPLATSSAVCAGVASLVPGGIATYVDQRGFVSNAACVDAGADQSNYITVTTGADDAIPGTAGNCPGAVCTLRDAIAAANAVLGGDIDFANGVHTVTIGIPTTATEGPSIFYDTNIIGPGANSLTVTGQNGYVLLGAKGGNVYLSGMTFANGYNNSNPPANEDGTGGAIYNQTNLTVSGMSFTGNTATNAGGAIYSTTGSLTVLDSTFANNTAPAGSAIFNNSTNNLLSVEYSTFTGNTATNAGAIHSVYGAPLSVYNTTLSGNTPYGINFDNGTLVAKNDIFADTGECTSTYCPTSGGGNVYPASTPALAALGNYGGTTPTMIPPPGSSAICAGLAADIPAGVTTDERGFANTNTTYTGVTSPCVDAGAVQTAYTSAQFVNPGTPYTGNANSPSITPEVVVSVTENGLNQGGVPITLALGGTGPGTIAAGTGTATTVSGTGAGFGNLTIDSASGTTDDYTLSVSIPVVGTTTLTAGPEDLTLDPGPGITIGPATLPAATIGVAYAEDLTASGGTAPYTYTKTGTLPAGIAMSAAGHFTGTPTEAGSFTISVTATDHNGYFARQDYTLTVNAPTITMTPAAGTLAVTENVAYSQTFTAAAGTAPYTYTETGALPTGLSWHAGTHIISGTTTDVGSFPITVKATDSSTGTGAPFSQTFSYTLTVSAPTITIAPTTLTAATVGAAFSQQLTASGGVAAYTYAITSGALPAGVTLSNGGLLSGTPTAGGSFTFTVTSTDNDGNTGNQAYTWTVNAATITITPAAGTLTVTTNVAYSQTFTASGGTPTYTWLETGALPTGITFNTATATLSGTTAQTGSFPITIKATDSSTGSGPYHQSNAYTLTVSAPTITIAPTTLTAATVDAAYSQQLTASGGVATYTYAITSGALPAGVTLSAGGLLSGTPTAGGSFTFTVTATDHNGNTGAQAYTWTVNVPTITITPAAGTLSATKNVAYSQSFTASGGTATYTWLETGALPTGITFNTATATLSGTTAQTGSFPITIKATDSSTGSGPYNQSNSYTLSVTAPTITIAPTTLTAATVATAYSQQLTASGGVASYTYAITAGALPAGVTLSSGGLLSGTPTAGGSFTFTVTATDHNGNTGAQAYSWTVNGATITITPAAGTLTATGETAYSQTFTASGGTPTYTWLETGTLPTGITFNTATATLSGTATQGGSFPITIEATDSSTGTGPYSQTNAYTLTVNGPTITVSPASLTAATAAVAYSQTITATGGAGTYTYTETGTLPAGLTLSTAGVLAGTPTQAGSFPITVTAKDSDNFTGSKAYTLTVNGPAITLLPAAGALTATSEVAYSQTFTASGGTSPYTYTETGTLPTGITFSAGTLSGTPTQAGSFPISVKVTDSTTGTGSPFSQTNAYTLTVTAPTITITPASLTAATAGAAYSQQFAASGGTGTYTWTETGALPAGVTLSAAGLLSGTPTAAGSFPITVTAKDGDNFTGTENVTLTVNGPTLAVLPATLPAASTNVAYTQAFSASGGTSPYTWTETGALPTGVTWTAATATLAGTPTVSGTFPITIKVTDSTTGTGSPFSKTVGYTLSVSAPTITITPTTLPAATVAAAYSQSVAAGGGTSPYTYTVTTGALPAGLTLSSAGTIAGTPTAGGSFTFTVTAKDSANFTGTQNYTLTVGAPTVTLTPAAGTLSAPANAAYSQTFTASGGTAPYTYAETGTLPAGLTFNSSTGVLAGTPTVTGSFPITVKATDSSTGTGPYSSAAVAYTLSIGTAGVTITWANPSPIAYGTTLSGVLDATASYNGGSVAGTFTYTATPTGGTATTVTASTVLTAGSYTLTASFAPSNNSYAPPTPKTVALTVNQDQPTVAWTPASSIAYGTSLSALLNATASYSGNSVAGSFAYTATPTGGTAAAVSASTVLAEGTYTLGVTFAPTDTTDYKTATATAPLSVTGGTLTVTANNATRVYGVANPTFTGTITGQQNGDTFTESFTTTATIGSSVGNYSIVPSASGSNLSDYTVVIDNGTLTITQAASTTTLAANSSTLGVGGNLTLTATVASATTGTPTGTVSFYDGSTLLNTATLSAGVATYSTTTLSSGSHTITAVYSGDTNFTASSTTSATTITVAALDFTMTATPPSQLGNPGTTFTYQLAVAPTYTGTNYPGTVTFSATGLPTGSTVTFTPSSVAANAGPLTVNMAIATAATGSAAVQPFDLGRKMAPLALAFLLLPFAGTRRMRRHGRRLSRMICLLLLALGGVVATTALSGCGSNGGSSGQKTGQGTLYTVTVSGTTGADTHTATVTLTLE